MKIALLTADDRQHRRTFDVETPIVPPPQAALLDAIAKRTDVEMHLISCLQQPAKSPAKLAPNIYFHGLLVPKAGWMRTLYAGCVVKIRRKLREINPELVHGQGTERESALAAVLSGFPNVVTIHGIMQIQARLLRARPGSFYWLAGQLESFALRRSGGVFCNSAYTEDCLRPRATTTWRVPNPIREIFFETPARNRSGNVCTLLNIGTISPRKQQNELIEALRTLREEGLNFQVQFLGGISPLTPYGQRFAKLVEENRSFVSHLGFKNANEMIQLCDEGSALVHVASEETFGLSVAEALTRNLKLFGFKVGGVGEIAEGVEGAELVPSGDWAALKAAIRKWLAAGSPRPSKAAESIRKRYHPAVVAERHLEIYREVLNRSS